MVCSCDSSCPNSCGSCSCSVLSSFRWLLLLSHNLRELYSLRWRSGTQSRKRIFASKELERCFGSLHNIPMSRLPEWLRDNSFLHFHLRLIDGIQVFRTINITLVTIITIKSITTFIWMIYKLTRNRRDIYSDYSLFVDINNTTPLVINVSLHSQHQEEEPN